MGTVAHMPRPLALALLVTGLALGVLVQSASAASAPATTWLCRPGLAHDPCTPGQSTTRFSPAGARLGVSALRPASHPKIDCFYVYPTVSDQKTPLAKLHIDPEERSIALYQAARYSQHCRVFAPMYRQVTLQRARSARDRLTPQRSCATRATRDVRRRLARLPAQVQPRPRRRAHRPLAGLVRAAPADRARRSTRKPAVRRRLVSALLLGGNVLVKRGRDVGGDFKHVRACRSARQLGCVVAFSTFDAAGAGQRHVRAHDRRGHAGPVHEPGGARRRLGHARRDLPDRAVRARHALARGHRRCWAHPPDGVDDVDRGARRLPRALLDGRRRERAAGQPRAAARRRPKPLPDPTWGLHLIDANIALGNLTDLVRAGRGVRGRPAGPLGLGRAPARDPGRRERDRRLGRRHAEAEALLEVQLDAARRRGCRSRSRGPARLEQEVAAAQAEHDARRRRRAPTRAGRRGSCAGGRTAGSRRARSVSTTLV